MAELSGSDVNKSSENELIEPMIFSDPFEHYISKRLTKMQLADLRKSMHLTQKELSLITGLSVQCISDIESESSGNPTLKSLIKYLDSLGFEICFQKKQI